MRYQCITWLVIVTLSGCVGKTNYAPVTDITTIQPIPVSGYYHLRQGESIYEIAWRYGLDYQTIAEFNNLNSPYRLKPGMQLALKRRQVESSAPIKKVIRAPSSIITKPHVKPKTHVVKALSVEREPNFHISKWHWPADGRVIKFFSNDNNGINIAGEMGDPIYAAMSGKVVYAGDGIRGYGNLIIIKHNSTYLSAYANCQTLLVHEGTWVSRGQLIAKMGDLDRKQAMVHFEIRRAGKPINPIKVL